MKILIIERTSNNTETFTIRVGVDEGTDPRALLLSNFTDVYIDPTKQEHREIHDAYKQNADAIFEVDHVSTRENQVRLK